MKNWKNYLFILLLIVAAFAIYQNRPFSKISQTVISNERNIETEMAYGNIVHNILIDSSAYLNEIQNIGIYNNTGRITSLVIDAADSNHLIAGGDWGGLWVSHNRGTTWNPVNDFAPTLRVSAISQNNYRHNEYYYSTGVNRYENNVLMNDLLRSVDGGITFSQVTPATTPAIGTIDKLICSPADPNTVYFLQRLGANSTFGALYRTTDNFATFQKVFFIHGVIPRDFILLPGGEVVITSDNKVWTSQTGDPGSFLLSNNGIAAGVYNLHVAVCESQTDIRYAAGNFANNKIAVYKTTDGGTTWNFLDTLNISSNGGKNIIAVNPHNPDILFVGGVNVRGSSDGGLVWKTGAPGWDFFQFIFDKHQPNMVFFASDNGVQSLKLSNMSTFLLGSAKKYNNTLVVQDIVHGDHSINGNMTITGLMDIHTHVNRNNNTSVTIGQGDGMYSYCSRSDSNLAYFCYQGAAMYRITTATGNVLNYTRILNQLDVNGNGEIDEGAAFYNPYIMNEADHNQLFVSTLKRLWRSTDKGSNWAPISKYYGNTTYRISMANSNKPDPIVYWTNMDSIFVLPNAASAAPLSEFGFPVPVEPEKIFADLNNDSALFLLKKGLPSQILYAANMFSGNVLWTNFGANFPQNITPLCITAYPGNNQIFLVGAYEGGIYITLNGGQTWSKEKNFPNVRISHLKFRESDRKLFIYTYGRGVWSAKLPIAVVPLNLLSFYAVPDNEAKEALLSWKTSEEINTKSFHVERSTDGRNFGFVKNVMAKGQGNQTYNTAVPMIAQVEYFRLKMLDKDGSYTYSAIKKVMFTGSSESLVILENPIHNGILNIDVSERKLENSPAAIIDNLGRVVSKFTLTMGRQQVKVGQLPSGTYYIRTIAGVKKFNITK